MPRPFLSVAYVEEHGRWRPLAIKGCPYSDDGCGLTRGMVGGLARPGLGILWRSCDAVNNVTLTGNATVADGQWHHAAGVYDGVEVKLYVDGQLDASAPAVIGVLNVSAPLYIGRHYQNTQNAFAGTIDEVSIHDRALSTVEVLDLANTGIPTCP